MNCFITKAWYSQTFEFREKLLQFALGLLRIVKNTNSEIPRGYECDDRIVKCFPHVHVVTEHDGTAQVLVPSAMVMTG